VARATWSGAISFGLVSVPVQLFTAVRPQNLRFRQLNAQTKAPVKQKRVDAETGEEVAYDDIVKGFEVPSGGYVVIDPSELAELDPDASRLVDIRDFVDQRDIDPVYYDRPYYLAPDGEAAAKPYRLLTEAMERTGKVAIASFVMRGKEHLAAIRARDGLLVLSTMHHADEVADPAELDVHERLEGVEVRDREVAMAEQLIESLVTEFDPNCYPDEHRARVQAYLEAKAEGQDVELPTSDREGGEVVDLVAALERSLDRARGGAGGTATGGGAGGDGYEEMTKTELYELAQKRDLPGRSGLSKDELVAALRAADTEAGAA
jgi:DNA end-binding protein Ku